MVYNYQGFLINGDRTAFSDRWPDSRVNFTIIHSVGRSMSKCSFSKAAGNGSDLDTKVRTTFRNSAIEEGEKVSN